MKTQNRSAAMPREIRMLVYNVKLLKKGFNPRPGFESKKPNVLSSYEAVELRPARARVFARSEKPREARCRIRLPCREE